MAQNKILPTSDLGFRKIFSTRGKEYILQGFLQDIFDSEKMGRKITDVYIGNPYNIIDVNKLSTEEHKALLLNTELDIHCTIDNNCEIAIEMQVNKDKYIEERIFNNSALKYIANYARILYTKNKLENSEKKKKESKYSGLIPIISLNIFCYRHFKESEKAMHIFRLYDEVDKKHTLSSDRYTEIYFEIKKEDPELSGNLKAWQHFMRRGEESPESPFYIKEAFEMLKISNLTKEERQLHEVYERNRSKLLSREAYVHDEGFDQGHEQGASEKAIEIAKRLLKMGLSIEDVAKGADLDFNVVHQLR